MIPEEIISQAKQVGIVAYLRALGFKQLNSWNRNSRFENPLRREKNSSFDVDERQNLWYDRGEGKGGNIIQLVMQYRRCSFQEAVEELVKEGNFSLRCNTSPEQKYTKKRGVEIKKIKPLEALPLIKYVGVRAISIRVAKKYLKEAYFTVNGGKKQQFALAFPNKYATEKSGYELRNRIWKSCVGKKFYSVIPGSDCRTVLLFEGFMDFLSYLTYHKLLEPPHPTIVLNSLSLLNANLIQKLSGFTIYAYLDNDNAGALALKAMEKARCSVVDQSHLYKDFKDLNEFLIHSKSV